MWTFEPSTQAGSTSDPAAEAKLQGILSLLSNTVTSLPVPSKPSKPSKPPASSSDDTAAADSMVAMLLELPERTFRESAVQGSLQHILASHYAMRPLPKLARVFSSDWEATPTTTATARHSAVARVRALGVATGFVKAIETMSSKDAAFKQAWLTGIAKNQIPLASRRIAPALFQISNEAIVN